MTEESKFCRTIVLLHEALNSRANDLERKMVDNNEQYMFRMNAEVEAHTIRYILSAWEKALKG